jgi:methionyl-tRNA synthetase
VRRVLSQVEQMRLNEALSNVMSYVSNINGYLEQRAPWSLAKQPGRQGEVATVLYTAAEALRIAALLLWPVMPERTSELWQRLGWEPPNDLREGLHWGRLQPGSAVTEGEPLFPKEFIE